jgi:hypothetical protein
VADSMACKKVRKTKAIVATIQKNQREKNVQKFDFSIRTRDGQLVRRLIIAGRDQEEAERKLKQMYRHCEIVRCCGSHQQKMNNPGQTNIIEDITSLLKQESISA